MSKLALGIDIGGTNTVFGIIDETGALLQKRSIPTQAREGSERLISRIIEAAGEVLREHQVEAIGVGSAGQIDYATGTCLFANDNLPGWTGMPIAGRLREALGLPVYVDNDANVAALGEALFGAGKGVQHLVCLTLGTGVGGGIITHGQMVRGKRGAGGEVGHFIVAFDGDPCPCGLAGCLEAYASATAIVRRTRERLPASPDSSLSGVETLTAKAIFDAAKAGDPFASTMIAETAHYLAVGIAGLINLFDPDRILIGGGVSLAGPWFVEQVDRHLQSWSITRGRTQLHLCALGDDAGVIGAGALVFEAAAKR